MTQPTRPPLAGVRVIESSLLGPAAITTHLADLGAEVIKVESPAGDYVREMTWPIIEGVSLLHLHVNRGKRSLTLDLKQPEAVAVYKESTANTVDVVRAASRVIEEEISEDPELAGIRLFVFQDQAEEILNGLNGLVRAGLSTSKIRRYNPHPE